MQATNYAGGTNYAGRNTNNETNVAIAYNSTNYLGEASGAVNYFGRSVWCG